MAATDANTGAATTRTELFRLITTITDPATANAVALAGCYRQRRESETGYKALNTHQRGPRQVLRSRDPDGVTPVRGRLAAALPGAVFATRGKPRLAHRRVVAPGCCAPGPGASEPPAARAGGRGCVIVEAWRGRHRRRDGELR